MTSQFLNSQIILEIFTMILEIFIFINYVLNENRQKNLTK